MIIVPIKRALSSTISNNSALSKLNDKLTATIHLNLHIIFIHTAALFSFLLCRKCSLIDHYSRYSCWKGKWKRWLNYHETDVIARNVLLSCRSGPAAGNLKSVTTFYFYPFPFCSTTREFVRDRVLFHVFRVPVFFSNSFQWGIFFSRVSGQLGQIRFERFIGHVRSIDTLVHAYRRCRWRPNVFNRPLDR